MKLCPLKLVDGKTNKVTLCSVFQGPDAVLTMLKFLERKLSGWLSSEAGTAHLSQILILGRKITSARQSSIFSLESSKELLEVVMDEVSSLGPQNQIH